ncbi:MAG: hypothetical protein HC903_06880 [Methylacidiphilales bacterium]|nr:hypothetical protein [Candidatus Methylacidiphilales bacterium]NJR18243.1 hypothetical protein [Calothrix sp. CSU_2_0]
MNYRKLISTRTLQKLAVGVFLLGIIFLTSTNNPSFANQATPTKVEEFISRGTEPFWSVEVTKRGIVYSTPDNRKQTFSYVEPISASGRTRDTVRVYQLRGKNNILIIKKQNTCSDGMSDREYPYSTTLILGNQVLDGCAEKK